MRAAIGLAALAACLAPVVAAQTPSACSKLEELIKTTYDYRPSKLTPDQLTAKGVQMDLVWDTVRRDRKGLLPCLRKQLERADADVMFRFDCSALLVELDPSRASKELQVRCYTGVDLQDVDNYFWISVLSQLGSEGLDVSPAADKWLSDPKASYRIPAQGLHEYKGEEGALFLLGSMDEAQALPALLAIIAKLEHPGRDAAVRILENLATPEALRALKGVDPAGLSDGARKSLVALRGKPVLVKASAKPVASRELVLLTLDVLFEASHEGAGNLSFVEAMVPDAVAVLKDKDLARVREVRRKVATWANDHAVEAYNLLTSILMARVWKPALVK